MTSSFLKNPRWIQFKTVCLQRYLICKRFHKPSLSKHFCRNNCVLSIWNEELTFCLEMQSISCYWNLPFFRCFTDKRLSYVLIGDQHMPATSSTKKSSEQKKTKKKVSSSTKPAQWRQAKVRITLPCPSLSKCADMSFSLSLSLKLSLFLSFSLSFYLSIHCLSFCVLFLCLSIWFSYPLISTLDHSLSILFHSLYPFLLYLILSHSMSLSISNIFSIYLAFPFTLSGPVCVFCHTQSIPRLCFYLSVWYVFHFSFFYLSCFLFKRSSLLVSIPQMYNEITRSSMSYFLQESPRDGKMS